MVTYSWRQADWDEAQINFWDDENVLHYDCDGGYTVYRFLYTLVNTKMNTWDECVLYKNDTSVKLIFLKRRSLCSHGSYIWWRIMTFIKLSGK